MALIDLARADSTATGVRCAFGQWFDAQDVDMQTEVRDLFAAADLSTSVVARVMAKASGLAFNDEKTRRHRHALCVDCNRTGRLS